MLHSGSRGVGNAIGTMFIELAKQDALRHNANLPDRDLAYFERARATSATTCAPSAGRRSSRA
jgi:RNA-splicing ligase RtcB